jgi:hypothetical protein
MARSLALASLMIMAAALPAILPATGSAWAGSCDVDDYVTKAIGIEEPWLENAGYLFTQVTHNSAPQILTIAPEIEARFNDRLGMELDLPAFSAQEPVGRRPHAFGPMAVGLKGLGVQRCNPRGDRAMVLTGEIEGQYWADRRPSVLPGEGNSVTESLVQRGGDRLHAARRLRGQQRLVPQHLLGAGLELRLGGSTRAGDQ